MTEAQWTRLPDLAAAFFKASFVYPDNNRRVLESAQSVLDEVERVRESGTHVLALRFLGSEVRCGTRVVEGCGPLVNWLRETMRRIGLAGMEIGPEVTVAMLMRFAVWLRERTSARGGSGALEELPGLRPIDLVFGQGEGGEEAGDTSAAKAAVAPTMATLGMSRAIADRLGGIQESLSSSDETGGPTERVDLLHEIVRLLPIEALCDPKHAEELVDQILATIAAEIEPLTGGAGFNVDVELSRIVLSVAKKDFQPRDAPTQQVNPQAMPTGRPEDEKLVDDLDTVLAEQRALPEPTYDARARFHLNNDSEVLGVLLHVFVNTGDDRARSDVETRLALALRTPDLQRTKILEAHLDALLLPERGAPVTLGRRLVRVVRNAGRAELVERPKYLVPSVVARTFPALFVPFVDALTADDSASAEAFDAVCAAVSFEDVPDVVQLMAVDDAETTRRRIDKALSLVRGPGTVRFLRWVAEQGGLDLRGRVVTALKNLELPETEAAAIRAVHPSQRLPAAYLGRICAHLAQPGTAEEVAELHEESGEHVRRYIAATADDATQIERRIYAIQALRLFPSARTANLVRGLARRRLTDLTNSSARRTRAAAVETLRSFERGGKS